jgi:hypothetical protein
MSLREKLDAFRAQVESGTRIPISVVEKLHKSTEELIASGQAERAKKAGDGAPQLRARGHLWSNRQPDRSVGQCQCRPAMSSGRTARSPIPR